MTALIGIAVMAEHWQVIAMIFVAWILRQYLRDVYAQRRHENRMRDIQHRQLIERADQENQEYIDWGVYEGQYAGYTMPMTRPTYRMNLDDYDDGLHTWKTW